MASISLSVSLLGSRSVPGRTLPSFTVLEAGLHTSYSQVPSSFATMSCSVQLHFLGPRSPPVAMRSFPHEVTACCPLSTTSSMSSSLLSPAQRFVSSTYRRPIIFLDLPEMGEVTVIPCPALCCARIIVVLICCQVGGAAPLPCPLPCLRSSLPPTYLSDSPNAVLTKNSISLIGLSMLLTELAGTPDAWQARPAIECAILS